MIGIPKGSFLRQGMVRIHNFAGKYKLYHSGSERGVFDTLDQAKEAAKSRYRVGNAWLVRNEE